MNARKARERRKMSEQNGQTPEPPTITFDIPVPWGLMPSKVSVKGFVHDVGPLIQLAFVLETGDIKGVVLPAEGALGFAKGIIAECSKLMGDAPSKLEVVENPLVVPMPRRIKDQPQA